MGTNIFDRLKNSYTGAGKTRSAHGDDKPRNLTRYFGGHNRLNHPFVSGYWQLIMLPPDAIFQGDMEKFATDWWFSTAEGFTPPSRTLNKADVPGQGGLASSFVTGQTLTRTFTITFREYQNLPILNLIQLWCSVIDPYTGVSPLAGDSWLPVNYKGSAFVVLTKPTHSEDGVDLVSDDLEQVFYFHGVFPEMPPWDTLAQDISANDVIQHNVTFSFDGWPLTKAEAEVVDQAISLMAGKKYYNETYANYVGDVTSTAVATEE
jgi:hypothetical protein